MYRDTYDFGVDRLKRLQLFVSIVIAAYLVIALADFGAQFWAISNRGNLTADDMDMLQAVDAIYAFMFFASAAIIALWIYRAHSNLLLAGISGLEITPGWAVGYFFIPFANLVMPFRAMRQLWQASYDTSAPLDETPSLVGLWWGLFIGGGIMQAMGNLMLRNPAFNAPGLILFDLGMAMRVSSAVCLFLIVRRITAMQSARLSIGDTFT